ncbi:GH36-type glycosyl hydrolase domain-containing protein [Massilia yuzhufengensis]|uniref:Cellobiose phosphorylase n=1 Tax=Massilia yuzhufengensis TaxID=1164594 RepID=A0A1I1V4K1_9BURK|nr:glucoamylase family protein [Massilia yuzhufengensis]SFD75230.1 Cellobiose phosphorylase [Massilia yuzhufengensis]
MNQEKHPKAEFSAADGAAGLQALLSGHAAALETACAVLDAARRGGGALPPAAGAILDQAPLLDAQLRLARGQLLHERGVLPASGGVARVYVLAQELAAQDGGRIERDALAHFLAAREHEAALALAELRMLPAALRVALLERLRGVAERGAAACRERALAAEWAGRMIDTAERRSGDLVLQVADMARAVQPMGSSFVAELARRLQGQGSSVAQALAWIDARLADDGSSIARQVQAERELTAADGINAASSLAGLRQLGGIDWRALLEQASPVEPLLRADPDGSYPRMDGPTRDHYRLAVERLARSTGRTEPEVAQEALALAGVNRAPAEGGLDRRRRHIGYYLAGPGLAALELRLQPDPGIKARLQRRWRNTPLALHIGAKAVLSLLFTAAVVVCARQQGAGLPIQAATGLLALLGASGLAHALLDMMAVWLPAPAPTLRMDFEGGVPTDAQALVAVSARLASAAQVDALCRDLEVRYLANRDPRLRFCLLADLHDAPAEAMPGDAALAGHAASAIDALNRKHARTYTLDTLGEDGQGATARTRVEPFLLLQRPRVWSSGEHEWIGRARRRGQLADLNAYLAGAGRERFATVAGNSAGLAEIRYVIALDAATDLPRDAARLLAGAMAHPLNQPAFDASGNHIAEGHGMLRPITGSAIPGPHACRYQRLWADGRGTWAAGPARRESAMDGMFRWAAIYDVDAYERVLRGRLPDDALPVPGAVDEGCLHAGIDCGVRLEEALACGYGEHAVRRHRIVRAAWQVAGWVRGRIGAKGAVASNPMTASARWQLFDILRDSLVAPAMLLLLVLCWSTLSAPAFWSAAVLSVFFLPALVGGLVALIDRPHDAPWRQHLDSWARGARVPLVRAALATSFLPHAAWCQVDALVRAVWRRHVSRRRQLEWRPAALARPARVIENNWLTMWFAPVLAVATAVLLTFVNPYSVFPAAPILLVWFLSPLLAWWTSLPLRGRLPRLSAARQALLARLARRSWSFFEDHAGPANNWLPPESVQDHPHQVEDARTTPQGMAIFLLSTLAARDFGFVPPGELLRRLDASLASLALLERWNGHFLAAYDNATLAPCEPAYVSTVDSGWLALGLRTLAAGLDELEDGPIAGPHTLDGIRAALHVVDELAQQGSHGDRALVAAVWGALDPPRCRAADTLPGLSECLRHVLDAADALAAGLPPGAAPALRDWVARLGLQCRAVQDDLLALAPWLRAAQEYVLDASLTRIPTLRELAALDTPEGAQHGLARLVRDGRQHAQKLLAECGRLSAQARTFAGMDFGALQDGATGLLAAGCHVREPRLDADSCDLLASEARMAAFVAVAQGQLGQRHWWALGRPMRIAGGEQLLLSRTGALSDYLAPQLLMPTWRESLLDHAGRAAVRAQEAHGRSHGMPWGFSESACNAVDAGLRFQFGRFGIPAAALERGTGDGLVAAPYAAMLALPLAPGAALANLERMAQEGLAGDYGFFDAVDYTPGRLPHGERRHVVRALAARHQGMGLLALLQLLHDAPMQRRFAADPELRAALPLLHEAMPACGASQPAAYDSAGAPSGAAQGRVIDRAGAAAPELQLLSNGSYHVVVMSDGAGYSQWGGLTLTRWQPDPLGARGGLACVLRDTASNEWWSATLAPLYGEPERYEAVFAEGRASFRREDRGLVILADVVVAPEDDVELRRIRIRNTRDTPRTLELTSHAVLAPPPSGAWDAHSPPVRIDEASQAILCSFGSGAPTVLHQMAVRGEAGAPAFSSSCTDPTAVLPPLEPGPQVPMLAIRRSISLAPFQEITVDLVLGAAATPAAAREVAARHADAGVVAQAVEAAWTHGQAFLRALGVSEAQAQLYNRLAGCLLDPVPGMRAEAGIIERNVRGRGALLAYGVDGSRPLVVLQPGPDSVLVREALGAHTYWRARGLEADLLVLCESREIRAQVTSLGASRVHLLEDVPHEDRILLLSAAQVLLLEERGALADQLRRAAPPMPALPPPFVPDAEPAPWTADAPAAPDEALQFETGFGGYSANGREAVIHNPEALPTPCENALANGGFGAVLPATGPGSTWCGRRELHVTAGQGEAFYLRDEDSGAAWSPTPWPMPSGEPYVTRHGFGYTLFEHTAHGIGSELRSFVAPAAPLKYAVLKLRNLSSAARRLAVTGFVQWWLDEAGAAPGLQVVTGIDVASGALVARNAFGTGFGDKVGFFHLDAAQVAHTSDRREFVGRHRSLAKPAALERSSLGGALGAMLDPCAALQTKLALQPGEQVELVFLLGAAGPDSLAASRIVQQHGGAKGAALALRQVHAYWDELLGSVQVATPDPAFDLAANGWLPYAALSCAMGGAPAAQLQGAMAAVHGGPATLRAALLRAARDDIGSTAALVEDFLWLPYALHRYVSVTGDYGVLREVAGGDPTSGTRLARDDLYQYCVHGLRGCLRFGARGLPLVDARMHEDDPDMDLRPESVGLAFRLATVLQRFAEVADRRADFGFATTCRGAALALKAQAAEHGWDGATYGDAATQAWAALAGAEPGRVVTALGSVDAAASGDARTLAWSALALAGEGAGTRAWELAAAAVRSDGAPCVIMDAGGAGEAAGWSCMLLTDGLLGIGRAVDRLALAPLLPEGWESLRLRYRAGRTDYHVTVRRATVGELLVLDGQTQQANTIELVDDGREHKVDVYVERKPGDALTGQHGKEPGA